VSFEVHPGDTLALLGGNGSGKSTTLKVIAGLLPPSKGRVIFHGRDITHATPHLRQQLGISYLLQGGRVFPNLTVAENLRIAQSHARNGAHDHHLPPELGAIFPDLAGRHATRAGLLSGGQRQMLAIEMVLAQRPLLALLDEPSAALTEALGVSLISSFARDCQESPRSIILVEQNVSSTATLPKKLLLSQGTISTTTNNKQQTT